MRVAARALGNKLQALKYASRRYYIDKGAPRMLGAQSSGAMADKDSERPGIDLANFFRGMDPSFASSPVPDASPCVLLGPSGSGRSSMLFQYALQVALGGGHVLYICGKEQSQQRRPLLPPRLDEDDTSSS